MNILKPFIVLLLGLVMVTGCSRRDDVPREVIDDDSVEVGFTAGMTVTQTRAAFAADLPIVLYVYQREDPEVMDLRTKPHKALKGVTATGGTNSLSKIMFADIGDTFELKANSTYDFVLIVGSDELSYNNGSVHSIPHGVDVLVGRKEGVRFPKGEGDADPATVIIKFTEYGADAAGNLPHICSGTAVRVGVSSTLLSHLGSPVRLGIERADFKRLPASGTFDFASAPLMKLDLVNDGYRSNYNMIANTAISNITVASTPELSLESAAASGQIVSYNEGVILPYPLKTAGYKNNRIDIDFYINVNGGVVSLGAKEVEVPVFVAGYRYAFSLVMDRKEILLYLSVEPWDLAASWESGMGGDESTIFRVHVGSWSNVYWSSGMGGEGDKLLIGVGGWASATWDTDMGGTNEDGSGPILPPDL